MPDPLTKLWPLPAPVERAAGETYVSMSGVRQVNGPAPMTGVASPSKRRACFDLEEVIPG